jgi:hypothetical protein
MAKQVFKYILDPYISSVFMFKDAKIISAGCQDKDILIWAEVNTDNELELRNVVAIPTGSSAFRQESGTESIRYRFIDTVQLKNGLVFHIYEMTVRRVSKHVTSLNHPEIPLI